MNNFNITIKVRKHEPLIINENDLLQNCWTNIIELEQTTENNSLNIMQNNLFDDLLQNYFTLKMVYSEYNLDLTDDMSKIEDFIINHFERMIKISELERLSPTPIFKPLD